MPHSPCRTIVRWRRKNYATSPSCVGSTCVIELLLLLWLNVIWPFTLIMVDLALSICLNSTLSGITAASRRLQALNGSEAVCKGRKRCECYSSDTLLSFSR